MTTEKHEKACKMRPGRKHKKEKQPSAEKLMNEKSTMTEQKQKKQCMKHFSQISKPAIVMSLSMGHSPKMVM
jgi:hypothetical protein